MISSINISEAEVTHQIQGYTGLDGRLNLDVTINLLSRNVQFRVYGDVKGVGLIDKTFGDLYGAVFAYNQMAYKTDPNHPRAIDK